MKKIVLVLVLYLFWDGPANSKIIKLECPTSHVHKSLTIELDTEKKMAESDDLKNNREEEPSDQPSDETPIVKKNSDDDEDTNK
jgi:hypothetical protein